jgi:hypothetical protein
MRFKEIGSILFIPPHVNHAIDDFLKFCSRVVFKSVGSLHWSNLL